ncbi:hypothetical protein SO694_00016259 [Aureococcus anophagefferens]|uniref:Glycosyl transferase family 25 domain-containing protein n=1 Tax=Aureococcus anophagefferens TaxID=44056 RepID=A0ABR1G2U6_AURAN
MAELHAASAAGLTEASDAETAATTQDEATDDAETATTTHDEASDDGSDGADEPLELVIVGAGPHALALLLRLLDDAPDESGDFFVGLGSAPRSSRKSWSDLEKRRCGDDVARRILDRVRVVDGSGAWLGTWDAQFAALEIPHLRSTYDQHPCPYDSFALQQFVVKNGRERDVVDLDASVRTTQESGGDDGCDCDAPKGKGCGFKGNFRLPSTKLFRDFVDHLIDQYPRVRGCVTEGVVDRVDRLDGNLVRVRLATGETLVARRVVLAVGPAARRRACPTGRAGPRRARVGLRPGFGVARLAHAAGEDRAVPVEAGRARGPPAMLRAARARAGPSPGGARGLDRGGTAVVADVDVVYGEVDGGARYLDTAEGDRLGPFDKVWYATAARAPPPASPLFARLLADRPVAVVGGYPVLHASLRWDADTPVYVVGAAAARALGPGALNLAGTQRVVVPRRASVFRDSLRARCLGSLSAADAAAAELVRARRLEELVVDFVPKKGTVVVRAGRATRPRAACGGRSRGSGARGFEGAEEGGVTNMAIAGAHGGSVSRRRASAISSACRPSTGRSFFGDPKLLASTVELPSEMKQSSGEIGCSLSHLARAEMALELDDDYVMVMEDDIHLTFFYGAWRTTVKEIVSQAPPDWQVLQLTINNARVLRTLLGLGSSFVPWRKNHWSTGAYLINRRGCQRAVDEFTRGPNSPPRTGSPRTCSS